MRTIWKFPLRIASVQTIDIPADYHFLHMGMDGEGVRCLWFMVDPESSKMELEIIMVGTGQDVPHVGDFIGTVMQGGYVWHYFAGPANSINKTTSFHFQTAGN